MSAAHHIKLTSSGYQNVAQQINFYSLFTPWVFRGREGVVMELDDQPRSQDLSPRPLSAGAREREKVSLSVRGREEEKPWELGCLMV